MCPQYFDTSEILRTALFGSLLPWYRPTPFQHIRLPQNCYTIIEEGGGDGKGWQSEWFPNLTKSCIKYNIWYANVRLKSGKVICSVGSVRANHTRLVDWRLNSQFSCIGKSALLLSYHTPNPVLSVEKLEQLVVATHRHWGAHCLVTFCPYHHTVDPMWI